MNALIQGKVPFLAQFQRFYAKIVALKERAPASAEPDIAEQIWNRVFTLLDEAVRDTRWAAGPVGVELQRETLWVMAAMADETFVHLDWPGQKDWLSRLMETRFFDTHSAGTAFFQRIEAVLERSDPASEEMAAIYLLALGLGFRGRYWGIDDGGVLDSYRDRLFGFLLRRNPEVLDNSPRMFPQAYRHTAQEGTIKRLPVPRRWAWALAGVIGLWLVVSQILWNDLTQPLREKIATIHGYSDAVAGQAKQ